MKIFYPRVVFRRLLSACALTIWVIFALSLPSVEAQGRAACVIKITAPLPGDQVGKQAKVRGTAQIPAGGYLWVLAHMKDLRDDWWPQGRKAPAIDPDGTWIVVTSFGGPQDMGEDFEIAVAVVNEQVNAQLRQWVQKGIETKDFPPIAFPNVIGGCPPVKITVKKTSHD